MVCNAINPKTKTQGVNLHAGSYNYKKYASYGKYNKRDEGVEKREAAGYGTYRTYLQSRHDNSSLIVFAGSYPKTYSNYGLSHESLLQTSVLTRLKDPTPRRTATTVRDTPLPIFCP